MRTQAKLMALALLTCLVGYVASVPAPASAATVTLSHSISYEIVAGVALACSPDQGVTTTENSYFRVFALEDFGIVSAFTVSSVTFGIEALRGGATTITVNLYTLEGEFLRENLTLISSSTEAIEPTQIALYTMEVEGTAPAGSTLVVEIAAPDTRNQGAFFIGANSAGQTGPSYIASASCDLHEPRDLATLDQPAMHIVMEVNGTAGLVGAVEVTPSPSDEGQSVSASAKFMQAVVADPTCTVDYGDGSGPQPGTIADGGCTGPAHTYADNDTYTVTIQVCDGGSDCETSSTQHTVHNLAPTITAIDINGPAAPGAPFTISVTASDAAGEHDPLTYLFDCAGQIIGPQTASSATCTLDPSTASALITVQVMDDDGGSTSASRTVYQAVTLCAHAQTGALRSPLAHGGCPPSNVALSLPGETEATICIHPHSGDLRWAPNGACSPVHQIHVVPNNGPLFYCEHAHSGKLRYRSNSACSSVERAGVIPG